MKALVIDDSEALRTLFQIFLQQLGYTTDGAADGSDAFGMLQGHQYDLILSDMDMPVVDGRQLYKRIEEHFPHMLNRIIFATGSSLDGEIGRFLSSVSCPVLLKPFMLNDLKRCIDSVSGQGYDACINV